MNDVPLSPFERAYRSLEDLLASAEGEAGRLTHEAMAKLQAGALDAEDTFVSANKAFEQAAAYRICLAIMDRERAA